MSGDIGAVALWRRVDRAGHEAARLISVDGIWRLGGTSIFPHEGRPCCLRYEVACDAAWRTLSASVDGWAGNRRIALAIESRDGRWRLDGAEIEAVAGCVDVDLNFSPSTNLLPIRRLGLAVGQEAEVRAAWLRFPGFTLEPLAQRYRRIDEYTYQYESSTGFGAELIVDEAGLVVDYPGFCEREAEG
jgi:uncharacterized protein